MKRGLIWQVIKTPKLESWTNWESKLDLGKSGPTSTVNFGAQIMAQSVTSDDLFPIIHCFGPRKLAGVICMKALRNHQSKSH